MEFAAEPRPLEIGKQMRPQKPAEKCHEPLLCGRERERLRTSWTLWRMFPRQSPLLFFSLLAGCLAEFTNVYLSGPSSLLTQSLDEMCSSDIITNHIFASACAEVCQWVDKLQHFYFFHLMVLCNCNIHRCTSEHWVLPFAVYCFFLFFHSARHSLESILCWWHL